MNNGILKKIQKEELEILKDIDKFCKDNSIKYSLYAGTALGAVRHNGFIPWDDDIDIIIPRNDYEKFVEKWKNNGLDDYIFQIDGYRGNSPLNHSKMIRKNTILCSKDEFLENRQGGIWVDVFPMDKIPDKRILYLKMKLVASLRLVYTRNIPYGNKDSFLSVLSILMLKIPYKIKKKILARTEKYIKKYSCLDHDFHYISLCSPEGMNKLYSKDMFDAIKEIDFDGQTFSIVSDYDSMLKIHFGNYLELPPKEERICRHHPYAVKFSDSDEIIFLED